MSDTQEATYFDVEVTDTFGGEANYCWVKRFIIKSTAEYGRKKDRDLVRKAKAAAGWTGLRCQTSSYGDMIEVRPVGSQAPCWIMFITYRDLESTRFQRMRNKDNV